MGFFNSDWVNPFVNGKTVDRIYQEMNGVAHIHFTDKTELRLYSKKETVVTPFDHSGEIMQSEQILKNRDVVAKAKELAFNAHSGQFRRDNKTPYFNHVESVANRLQLKSESGEVIATAYLHDVLEDTDLTSDDLLSNGIPQLVVDAVITLTHSKNTPYVDYLQEIKKNPISRKVKIADMIDNLSDNPTERQIKKYINGLYILNS